MKRFAFLVLVIPMLACGTYITPTPVPTYEITNTVVLPTPTAPLPTPTELVIVASSTHAATVAKAVVNVRESPNGAVVGSLEAGQTVNVLGCSGNWCKIDDPAGYVWQGCLSDNPDGLGCEAR